MESEAFSENVCKTIGNNRPWIKYYINDIQESEVVNKTKTSQGK